MAGRTGLDYAGCQTVLSVHSDGSGQGPFDPLPETWVQLQTIENALLEVDAERRAKDHPDGD